MTIRIDTHRQAAEAEAANSRRVDTSRKPGGNAGSTPAGSTADRVEVSGDAQLMQSVLKAAAALPAVRPDVVERARRALEAGQIGQDSAGLADKLIDDLLDV